MMSTTKSNPWTYLKASLTDAQAATCEAYLYGQIGELWRVNALGTIPGLSSEDINAVNAAFVSDICNDENRTLQSELQRLLDLVGESAWIARGSPFYTITSEKEAAIYKVLMENFGAADVSWILAIHDALAKRNTKYVFGMERTEAQLLLKRRLSALADRLVLINLRATTDDFGTIKIVDLRLSARTFNALYRSGFTGETVADLTNTTEEEIQLLTRGNGFGKVGMEEVKNRLEFFGLTLTREEDMMRHDDVTQEQTSIPLE